MLLCGITVRPPAANYARCRVFDVDLRQASSPLARCRRDFGRRMTTPSPSRHWLKPWMVLAALAVAASVVLNLVAASLGHSPPWLLGVNLTVALLVLGAGILAVARLSSRTDAEALRMRSALDASQARLAAIV